MESVRDPTVGPPDISLTLDLVWHPRARISWPVFARVGHCSLTANLQTRTSRLVILLKVTDKTVITYWYLRSEWIKCTEQKQNRGNFANTSLNIPRFCWFTLQLLRSLQQRSAWMFYRTWIRSFQPKNKEDYALSL